MKSAAGVATRFRFANEILTRASDGVSFEPQPPSFRRDAVSPRCETRTFRGLRVTFERQRAFFSPERVMFPDERALFARLRNMFEGVSATIELHVLPFEAGALRGDVRVITLST
jgi:hypothetical protein